MVPSGRSEVDQRLDAEVVSNVAVRSPLVLFLSGTPS